MCIIRCGEQKSFQGWSERRRRGAKILSRRGSQWRAIWGGEVRTDFEGEMETRDPRAVILTFYPGSHVGPKRSPTIGEGGDRTISSPGRSPKQPLPGIGLHGPLHGRQACPEFIAFDQGVGQICSGWPIYFRAASSQSGEKNVTSPPPPNR